MFKTFLIFSAFFAALSPCVTGAQYPAGAFEIMVAPREAAHPRNTEADVVVLKDGSLFLAWSDFHGGSQDAAAATISAATSRDGGRTWSPRYTLQPGMGGLNVMSVSLLRTRSGDILLFFADKRSHNTHCDFYVRRSSDEGLSWGPPVLMTPGPGFDSMNNARAIQLSSGRILCPMASYPDVSEVDSLKGRGIVTVMSYSDDDGRTWIKGGTYCFAPGRGAMEPGVVELADGRVLQVIRTTTGHIWHSHSRDGGDTWSPAEAWKVASPESPSTIVRIPGTRDLLLIYNPNPAGKRTPLVASISSNEGRSWSEPVALESDLARTFAYVSVTFDGPDALLTYYVDETSLKFRRLPISGFYSAVSIKPAAPGFLRPRAGARFLGRDALGRRNVPRQSTPTRP